MKRSALAECCEGLGQKPLAPVKVVATRWNSHVEALKRHLVNREAVSLLTTSTRYKHLKLGQYTMRAQEWIIVEQLEPALNVCLRTFQFTAFITCIVQAFKSITQRMSTADVPLLHHVIPAIDYLRDHLERLVDNDTLHPAVRHAANNGIVILDKYYARTDDSEMFRVAMSKFHSLIMMNIDH